MNKIKKSNNKILESLTVDIWRKDLLQYISIKDRRNKKRLSLIIKGLTEKSTGIISEAFSTEKERDGFYNFIEKDSRENAPISYEDISGSYCADTVKKCLQFDTILSVQDTTYFDYNGLLKTTGLGYTSGEYTRGVVCHSTVAVSEEGIPIGLLDLQLWCRNIEEYGKRQDRKNKPMEEKESFKWLKSLMAIRKAFKQLQLIKQIKIIHVADREGDISEVLSGIKAGEESCVIRCAYDRNSIDKQGDIIKARKNVQQQRPKGEALVPVDENMPSQRYARLTLRSCPVKLRIKSNKFLEINLVSAREENPPEEVKNPLDWLLYTFEPIDTLDAVIRVCDIYKKRWTIEQYHKSVKGIMKVESSQLKTDGRIKIYLAMCLPVALRALQIKLLSQKCPDEPCTTVYTEDEWKSAQLYVHKDLPPDNKTPTIFEMTKTVARIGGYHGRKSDGPPGLITLGRGLVSRFQNNISQF